MWNPKTYLRVSRSISENGGPNNENIETKNQIQILSDHESAEMTKEGKSQIIHFEQCFKESSTNYEVYVEAVDSMLHRCLQGVHGTVFCCESGLFRQNSS
jgi:hypothetical protein